jgi:glycosyltransferase involved in cell wall biosynthesis
MGRANLRGLGQRPTMAVVANSHRTAQLLIDSGATGSRPITVIYPPTQPPAPPVDGLPRAFCTQVNLSQAKGGEILQRVSRALPDVPFLAVIGGHGEQIMPPARITNVTPYGHFSGLGLPYAMTKVLLAPSKDETYGMVVAEATALGIPVIASDIAAHREALGDSPTYVDLADYSGWANAVKRLMLDDDAWQAAHERAAAYGVELAEREDASYARWDQLITYLAAHGEAQPVD